MQVNLFPFVILWCVFASVIAGLALYRKLISRHEDDCIHLDAAVSAQQAVVDRKLTLIDRWGKSLTVIEVVYGVLIVGLYVYQGWNTTLSY